MSVIFRYTLSVAVCLFSLPAGAADSFSAVMERMKPQGPISIHYDEVRYLELMDEPWRGSGNLYALPPDMMLKEQQRPASELMGVKGNRMYYLNREDNERHSGEMRPEDPLAAHLEAFRALMNGDREAIDKLYRVAFLSKPKRWELTLTAKDPEIAATLAKIVVSGIAEKPADTIEIHQADGERMEFALRPEVQETGLAEKVEALYKELLGD
jgi:hypothetical protein